MGNSQPSGKTKASSLVEKSANSEPSSPRRGDDSMKDSSSSSDKNGKKKPIIYQSSTECPSDDNSEEYKSRPRTTTVLAPGTEIDENALPTVFKWEGGGKDVYITGTFSEWKPIKMCSSHGDFVAIVDVPEGKHEYKYIVDGMETLNMNVQKDETTNNNVIHVKKADFEVFEALAMDLASNTKPNLNNSSNLSGSPPGEYSQVLPSNIQLLSQRSETVTTSSRSTSGSGPPILPPHLLQVILNNPSINSGDSTILPQPNHVMLNHLYALSIKDGVMVLSCTHRYRKKYVTTLLYKPI
ncbi:5'-AMP-activated protein kinase subunit beta-1 [Halotydeus destructor]|nr:5'-AMP-activated protein kinase subunit beta-1 [Halotydeus destructor]